jgi:integrase
MGSVYPRWNKLYLRYKDAEGKWRDKVTPYRVGQEREARKLLRAVESKIAAGKDLAPEQRGPLTLRAFADLWHAERVKLGIVDAANDLARLRDHVLPALGHLAVADVQPRHLAERFYQMRLEGKLAVKTRWNVYSTLTALFRDAHIRGLVDTSPCILTRHQLGTLEDADPEWRETAVYTRAELGTLLYDERIPWDRRVWYALEGIGALRLGEAAGLRVRHYKRDVAPLRGLTVAYSHKRPRPKSGIRHMPVHPALAAILDEWLARGWRETVGRDPGSDDLLVPMPPEHMERKRGDTADAMRNKTYVYKRIRDDLAALGLRHRRSHDLRRTMISLARTDGARADLLERVTHNPKKRDRSIDVYSTFEWAPLCAEIAKLRVERPGQQDAPEGTGPAGALAAGLAAGNASAAETMRRAMVEAPGVELGASALCQRGPAQSNAVDGLEPAAIRVNPSEACTVENDPCAPTCSIAASAELPPFLLGARRYLAGHAAFTTLLPDVSTPDPSTRPN